MQDGRTRKIVRSNDSPETRAFFDRHRAALVTLTGTTAGNEYVLEQASHTVGRGPEADLRFDDEAMSREHAAFELVDEGFRVRDLGSTNGIVLNGSATLVAELKHGDKLEVGGHTFQYVVEARDRGPRTYVVDEDL